MPEATVYGVALVTAFAVLSILRWTTLRGHPATFLRFLLALNLLHYAWWDVRWAVGLAAYAAAIFWLARVSYRHRLAPLPLYDWRPLMLLPVPVSVAGLLLVHNATAQFPLLPWDFNPAKFFQVGLTLHVVFLLGYLLSVQRKSAVPTRDFARLLAHGTFAGSFLAGPVWKLPHTDIPDVLGRRGSGFRAARVGGQSLLRAAVQWGLVALLSTVFDGPFISLRHGETVSGFGWAMMGSAVQLGLMWRAAVDTGHGAAVLLGLMEAEKRKAGRGFWPSWVDQWNEALGLGWRSPFLNIGLLLVLLGVRWHTLGLVFALVVFDAAVKRNPWFLAVAYPLLVPLIFIYRSDDWSMVVRGFQCLAEARQWMLP